MTTVLLRMAGADTLDGDAEPEPANGKPDLKPWSPSRNNALWCTDYKGFCAGTPLSGHTKNAGSKDLGESCISERSRILALFYWSGFESDPNPGHVYHRTLSTPRAAALLFRRIEKRFGRIKGTLSPERGIGKSTIRECFYAGERRSNLPAIG